MNVIIPHLKQSQLNYNLQLSLGNTYFSLLVVSLKLVSVDSTSWNGNPMQIVESS